MTRSIGLVALLAAAACAETVDFEALPKGQLPPMDSRARIEPWGAAMTGAGAPPQWEVRWDATAPSGRAVLAQISDDHSSGRFPMAIYRRAAIQDGEIRVRFKAVSGSIDQAAGLVWRYQDQDNYYVVRANALEDNVVLYKVERGKRSSIPPTGRENDYGVMHTVRDNAWTSLAVAFAGSRFAVFCDGEKLFEVQDATFTAAGQVGLWTKADSVTYFDDFEVSEEKAGAARRQEKEQKR